MLVVIYIILVSSFEPGHVSRSKLQRGLLSHDVVRAVSRPFSGYFVTPGEGGE